MKFQVSYEHTPNPQSLKFVVNASICDEILEVNNKKEAGRSPLASKILGFPWAKSVFIGINFVTVTKEDWVEWDILSDPLSQMIQEHLEKGEKVILPKQTQKASSNQQQEASPTVQKIKEILERDIQPAVAMDGGYIEFVSYQDNKVYLSLQGACAGCPSSTYTLKAGIEQRLKQDIPEIEEVISI